MAAMSKFPKEHKDSNSLPVWPINEEPVAKDIRVDGVEAIDSQIDNHVDGPVDSQAQTAVKSQPVRQTVQPTKSSTVYTAQPIQTKAGMTDGNMVDDNAKSEHREGIERAASNNAIGLSVNIDNTRSEGHN